MGAGDTVEKLEGEAQVSAGCVQVDERVEDEDVAGVGRGLEDHGVESGAEARGGEAGGGFDGEGEGEVVGEERGVEEQAGEEEEAEVGLGVSVGADEGVPGVEVWLGDLVEQEEGVGEVAEGGEGAGCEELAGRVGVGEEVEAEHVGVDLLQPPHVQGGLIVVEKPQHWMVTRKIGVAAVCCDVVARVLHHVI